MVCNYFLGDIMNVIFEQYKIKENLVSKLKEKMNYLEEECCYKIINVILEEYINYPELSLEEYLSNVEVINEIELIEDYEFNPLLCDSELVEDFIDRYNIECEYIHWLDDDELIIIAFYKL